MSEKGFSVEEILKELRSSATTDEIRADYQSYDAQKVVREVLNRTAQLQQTQTPTNDKTTEQQVNTAVEPEEIASPVDTVEAQVEGETAPPTQEQSQVSGEQELTETHIRYISLRKNREEKVKSFVLSNSEELNIPENILVEETEDTTSATAEVIPETEQETKEQPLVESSEETATADEQPKQSEQSMKAATKQQKDKTAERQKRYESLKKNDLLRRIQYTQASTKQKSFVLGGLFLVSLLLTALGQWAEAPALISKAESPMIYATIQFVLLLAAGLFQYEMLLDGIKSLFKWNLNMEALYSLGVISSVIAGLVFLIFPSSLNQASVEFYVPLSLMVLFSASFGQWLVAKRMSLNFPTAMASDKKHAVCVLEDERLVREFTKDVVEEPVLVYNCKTPDLTDFVEESMAEDLTDDIPFKTVPILLGAAVVAGIFAVIIGDGFFTALTAFHAVLLLGAGMIPAILCNYPLYHAAKNLSYLGGAVLGYPAVEHFADANAATIHANEIFKGSDVTLYGIKTFSDIPIDRAILDAACLLSGSNSILGEVFLNIIDNRTDYLDEVDNILYEDGMGISAWVGENRVLVGSRELMIHHNISVPSREYEDKYLANDRHLIYLATNGDLSAVFVIGLECSADIANLITGLYANGVTAIVKTVDPIITGSLLSKVFRLPEHAFKVIPSRMHKEMDKLMETDKPLSAAVCNNGKLASYLYSFLLAKGLQRSIDYGKLVYFFSMALGVLLVVGFTAIHGLGQLGSLTLCLYQLISLAVCYLIQKLTRL